MAKENFFWIDFLRVIASFGVVLLHVAAPIMSQYGEVPDSHWWISNIYCNFVRCRIPIFLMISGALILPKAYGSLKEYLNKRVLRIIYPFLFWSLIYIVRQLFRMHQAGDELSFVPVLKHIVLEFKYGASFHLWYVYLVIGLNLFFPILGKWIRNSGRNEILYFLVIWAVTVIAALPYINKVFPNIDLQYFAGCIGFVVLGYYLMTTQYSNTKRVKQISLLLIILGTLVTIIGTFIMTKRTGVLYTKIYGNLSPSVIITGIGVFLLFKYLNFARRGKIFSSVVHFLSKYSYGIYLAHVFIIGLLTKVGINHSFINPAIAIPVTSILCFALSAGVVWGINKLPYGKYISG